MEIGRIAVDQGLDLIELGILYVLLKAKYTGEGSLHASEISKRLGLRAYRDKASSTQTTYTLIREVLLYLQYHGSDAFQRDPQDSKKWRITTAGNHDYGQMAILKINVEKTVREDLRKL